MTGHQGKTPSEQNSVVTLGNKAAAGFPTFIISPFVRRHRGRRRYTHADRPSVQPSALKL